MSNNDDASTNTNRVRYPNIKVLVLLYANYEEMEFDAVIGCIRRGGIMVTVAGKDMNPVVGSRGIRKLPNMTTKEAMRCGPWDCIVLIGGQFAWKPLAECKDVGILLREQEKAGRLIASVCTAPLAMNAHGVMYGKKLTSYPMEIEKWVRETGKYKYRTDHVVEDGNLISSRGNYTSFHWGLAVVERLTDIANARDAGTEMIVVY